MMVLDGLPKTKQGYFRLLETNKRVILPTNTHLRLLVTQLMYYIVGRFHLLVLKLTLVLEG